MALSMSSEAGYSAHQPAMFDARAASVEGFMRKHEKHLQFIQEHAPERYGPLRSEAWAHMKQLEGKAA